LIKIEGKEKELQNVIDNLQKVSENLQKENEHLKKTLLRASKYISKCNKCKSLIQNTSELEIKDLEQYNVNLKESITNTQLIKMEEKEKEFKKIIDNLQKENEHLQKENEHLKKTSLSTTKYTNKLNECKSLIQHKTELEIKIVELTKKCERIDDLHKNNIKKLKDNFSNLLKD